MNAIYVRADHVVSPYSDAVSSDAGNSGSQDNNIDNSTPFGRTEDSAVWSKKSRPRHFFAREAPLFLWCRKF